MVHLFLWNERSPVLAVAFFFAARDHVFLCFCDHRHFDDVRNCVFKCNYSKKSDVSHKAGVRKVILDHLQSNQVHDIGDMGIAAFL